MGTGAAVQDIITEALNILGVYSDTEGSIAPNDLATSLFTLQAIVDGWALESLTVYNSGPMTFQTVAGKSFYVVGPSGSGLSGADPDWVIGNQFPFPASIQKITYVNNGVIMPVKMLTELEYASLAITGQNTGAMLAPAWVRPGFPGFSGYPNFAINFAGTPNGGISVSLWCLFSTPQSTVSAATNVLQLPAGYQEALTYELALKLAPKFGAVIPQYLPEAWQEAKFKIKAANYAPAESRVDRALQPRGGRLGGVYNIFTDQ